MLSITTVLNRTAKFLADNGVQSSKYEAELLMSHALKMNRMELYLNFDKPLDESELQTLRPLVKRRAKREPMAWILGEWGFHNYDFIVTPGVLCPRPDTETLVEAVLQLIPKEPLDEKPCFIADIGCGSGCIGLTIALERPHVRVFSVDISEDAIACTKANVEKHGLQKRVAVLKGPFFDPIPTHRTIDVVVSNPPYIPSKDILDLEPEVRVHEPKLALDGGPNGLDVYNALIPMAQQRANLAIAVEVGIHQAASVESIMKTSGLHSTTIHNDLNGIERVVMGQV